MTIKTVTFALLAFLLSACNPMQQLEGAEEAIERFHTTYNEGNGRALYGLTSQEFRSATTPAEMDDLVAALGDRLGAVRNTEREGFNLNTNNGLTISTVTMRTQFEKGEGTETFTFYGTGDDMRLVAWNVDSPRLAGMSSDPAPDAQTVTAAAD